MTSESEQQVLSPVHGPNHIFGHKSTSSFQKTAGAAGANGVVPKKKLQEHLVMSPEDGCFKGNLTNLNLDASDINADAVAIRSSIINNNPRLSLNSRESAAMQSQSKLKSILKPRSSYPVSADSHIASCDAIARNFFNASEMSGTNNSSFTNFFTNTQGPARLSLSLPINTSLAANQSNQGGSNIGSNLNSSKSGIGSSLVSSQMSLSSLNQSSDTHGSPSSEISSSFSNSNSMNFTGYCGSLSVQIANEQIPPTRGIWLNEDQSRMAAGFMPMNAPQVKFLNGQSKVIGRLSDPVVIEKAAMKNSRRGNSKKKSLNLNEPSDIGNLEGQQLSLSDANGGNISSSSTGTGASDSVPSQSDSKSHSETSQLSEDNDSSGNDSITNSTQTGLSALSKSNLNV